MVPNRLVFPSRPPTGILFCTPECVLQWRYCAVEIFLSALSLFYFFYCSFRLIIFGQKNTTVYHCNSHSHHGRDTAGSYGLVILDYLCNFHKCFLTLDALVVCAIFTN